MIRILYRVALVLVGLFLYAADYDLWMLCAAAFVWSVLQHRFAIIFGLLNKLATVPEEHEANSVLRCDIRLDRIFEHPSVEALFEQLLNAGKAPTATLREFRQSLSDSYRRKYGRVDDLCPVEFNIKNNLLFKNKEVDFGDYLYHEIEIPYRWDGDKPAKNDYFVANCEHQLSIRVLVVNGILKVDVGEFDKKYSPKIWRSGGLAVYDTHATISSFPLIYFGNQHAIPVRYLNLSYHATPSYKAHFDETANEKKQFRNSSKDWKSLHKDVASYRVLCDYENPNYSYRKIEKIEADFQRKREPLLSANNFELLGETASSDRWIYPDVGHEYFNQFGSVFFRNMNANRDSHTTKHWFTDYYEERP
jgi:hypothetical protein